MAKFIPEDIDEGTLEGYISVIGKEIEVNLDSENDNASKVEEFSSLINMVEKFSDYLTVEKFDELKQNVSKEITESGYEQEGSATVDYATLQNDLDLVDLYVFNEGFVLTFNAQIFADSDIIVQLNEDYSLDDIAVYSSDEFDDE